MLRWVIRSGIDSLQEGDMETRYRKREGEREMEKEMKKKEQNFMEK